MAPKNQMAREIEELKEALEREKREKRELEAARERERRERVQLSARIEALEKESEQPRVDENNEHLDSHNEGSGHEEHREEIVDPEEKRLCEEGKEDNDTGWKDKTKLQQNSSLKEQHGCSFNSIRVGGIDCPVIEKRDVVKPLSLQMILDQNSDKRTQEEYLCLIPIATFISIIEHHYYQVTVVIKLDSDKFDKWIKEGVTTVYIRELSHGFTWERDEPGKATFEQELMAFMRQIDHRHLHMEISREEADLIHQSTSHPHKQDILDGRMEVWQDGDMGWVAWIPPVGVNSSPDSEISFI
ncbi:hypothetical protein SUGI_0853140 [Cryptomeria japonica]|nr:hypothetical protein SUGI_0853140 [Cryptomeria japonica]